MQSKGPPLTNVARRYEVCEKIGQGSFGEIFLGQHVVTHQNVAIKIENSTKGGAQLKNESKIYHVLKGCPTIPEVFYYGTEGQYNVLVMEHLGDNLETYLHKIEMGFCLKSILMMAEQMLMTIQYIHERSFIHRDIKPENFLFGLGGKQNILYLIDFGLSRKYRDPKTHEHIPYCGDKELVGTSRYVSINTHMGIEQSRRDDLESLGYVLIYLFKGKLPWQGLAAKSIKEKYEKIAQKKMTSSYESLCEGLPREFVTYFEIVRSLGFTERPPYEKLRALFRQAFIREGFVYDSLYELTERPEVTDDDNSNSLIPVHAPLYDGEERGLDSNESPLIFTAKEEEIAEKERPSVIVSSLPAVKVRSTKRKWVDPGARRPFPRGPPPIPAKLFPASSLRRMKERSRSTIVKGESRSDVGQFLKTTPPLGDKYWQMLSTKKVDDVTRFRSLYP